MNIPVNVRIIASGIFIGAGMAYIFWYRRKAVGLLKTLRQLTRSLAAAPGGWGPARGVGKDVSDTNPAIKSAWKETEERVIPLPNDQRAIHVMLGPPRDIWSSHFLLGKQLNLPLAEAVPNLLVGIGLLCTFFFLSIALMQATSTLGNGADPTVATRELLQTAGSKFITSLAGLLASIIWTWLAKGWIFKIDCAAEEVLKKLSEHVQFDGGEMITFASLQTSRDINRDINQNSQHQLVATQDLGGLTEEMLNEAREQTGTFKRFETDLAVSLANAITQSFSPQMETMTNRLITAIDGLSNKIGTMNQEALERMLRDFSGMLKEMTESEMTELKKTLVNLATQLNDVGQTIADKADEAVGKMADKAGEVAGKLDVAGNNLYANVEKVSASLVDGAASIDTASVNLKETMNDLDATISNASEVGNEGVTFLRGALDTSTILIDRLKSALTDLSEAAGAMERVSGQLSNAVDNVEELAKEQHEVVTAVNEATPRALAAIQRVQGLLEDSVRQTAIMTKQIEKSMQSTTEALHSTVATINEGISEYTDQVAKLHQTMDAELAKAVGSLSTGVTELEGAIEDLDETLSTRLPKS